MLKPDGLSLACPHKTEGGMHGEEQTGTEDLQLLSNAKDQQLQRETKNRQTKKCWGEI